MRYQAGISTMTDLLANAGNIKSGIYVSNTIAEKYIECGFKPSLIVVTIKEKNQYYIYDSLQSTTKSYRMRLSDGITEFDLGGSLNTQNQISSVDNNGFSFWIVTDAERTLYWTAFK